MRTVPRQGIDIASRVLLDRCDNDALDLGLLLWVGHPYISVMTTMKDSLPTCLLDAADRLRKLALRAPDIAHELRRFADELEQEALQARRGTEQKA